MKGHNGVNKTSLKERIKLEEASHIFLPHISQLVLSRAFSTARTKSLGTQTYDGNDLSSVDDFVRLQKGFLTLYYTYEYAGATLCYVCAYNFQFPFASVFICKAA